MKVALRDAVAPDVPCRGKLMPSPFALGLCASAGLLIVSLLAAMVRRFRSPAWDNLVADVYFTLSAIEHEGQDGRP